jgi:outer membrane protein assembly factor BamB
MTSERGWVRWPKVLLASVVVPPAGFVLAWLLPWKGGWAKRLGGLIARVAVAGFAAILTIVYAVGLGLVHVEMSGAGWKPIISLRDPELDRVALEQHRARQQSVSPVPTSNPEMIAVSTVRPKRLDSSREAAVPAWTDFRGPHRDGNYTEGPILTSWPATGLPLLWRQPIGGGYASFVIANGKAYTIEQRRAQEVVAAYAMDSGRELWTHGWPAFFQETMGGDGPRATPVFDSGRIYALGAAGELRVLDAESGKLLWSRDILADNGAENITWGMANAPLIVDGKVIVTPGGPAKSVVAYDTQSGERVWAALSDQAAYTSPMTVTLAGQRQVLVVTASRIVGLTPDNGKLLWEYAWKTFNGIASAQPIILDGNRVFVSSGYDHGSVLLEISGAGASQSARPVWESRNMKNRFNSSVAYQNHIYGMDESILACIDASTGERKWKGGRYGYGQILLAGEHLVVLTESGDVVLVKATPDSHQEVARFPAIEGKTWNHPAIAGGVLLVRNAREMAAFRIGR